MWEKFKENIAALVAVAVFAWIAGNVQGTSETSALKSRIDQMERDVARHDKQLSGRSEFMACAIRRFDYIDGKGNGKPPCELRIPE